MIPLEYNLKDELGLQLNALDIHNEPFSTQFRGYNRDEVNSFLDIIIKDYEKMEREFKKLKAQLAERRFEEEVLQTQQPAAQTNGEHVSKHEFDVLKERVAEIERKIWYK